MFLIKYLEEFAVAQLCFSSSTDKSLQFAFVMLLICRMILHSNFILE